MKRMRMLAGLAALASVFGLTVVSAADDEKKDEKAGSDFVMKATACGLAEVNLSNLALTRSKDSAIREFAQKMVADHTKANRELLAIANRKQIPAAKTMSEKHQKMFEELSKMKDDDFNRAFMKGMVKDHEEVIKLFDTESKNGKDETLKTWAGKTLPILKKHLEAAHGICDKFKDAKSK